MPAAHPSAELRPILLRVALALLALLAGTASVVSADVSALKDTAYLRGKLERAETYFRSVGAAYTEADVQVLYPFLVRRFGRTIWPADSLPGNQGLPLLYRTFWVYSKPDNLLAGPGRMPADSLLAQLQAAYASGRTDAFTAHACLCPELALPADFLIRLDERLNWGVYELTHAAMQYRNLYLGACIPQPGYEAAAAEIGARLAAVLAGDAEPPGTDTDMLIESAIMLYYLQSSLAESPRVANRIADLVEKQGPNGGWSRSAGMAISQHTTLLAWWLLLEIYGHLKP